jgi:hypothetical protein
MEYKSSAQLLGLPLFHFATGRVIGGQYRRGIARGWIAVGDIAFGGLLALGGIAVGTIGVGGLAVGGIALAGLSVGVTALGGLAVGLVAAGGAAIGWTVAVGGLAVAREFAMGGAALAPHANDAAVREFLQQPLGGILLTVGQRVGWLGLLLLLPIVIGLRAGQEEV